MCIIIDACCAHYLKSGDAKAKPIHEWVTKKNGRVATGGKNLRELVKCGLGRILAEYRRAAKLSDYPEAQINQQAQQVPVNQVKSNDHHVIYLARVSGSRLVFTEDNNLKSDLKNAALVPKRGGKPTQIYQSEKDKRKLTYCPSCH